MKIANYIKTGIIHWPNWLNLMLLRLNVFGGLVYGRGYLKFKRKLERGEIDADKLLLDSVNYAIGNVKYYRDRYGDLTITSVEEFKQKIGYIDKTEVMSHWEDFIADGVDLAKCDVGTTGGTSGKPLKIVLPQNRYIVELAHVHRQWESTGWRYNLRAVLTFYKLPANKTYILNPITKELIFDAFRLSDEYVVEIVRTLQRLKVHYVQANPTWAYQFCQFATKQGLDLSFINAIFVSSENLTDEYYYFIHDKLGIKIFNLYGHSEKLILATNRGEGKKFYTEPTYGFTEILSTGESVGTTLYNRYMPLIRYRTGDFAEIEEVLFDGTIVFSNLYGRGELALYKSDGTMIMKISPPESIFEAIKGIQYIQEKEGELIVTIIKNDNWKDDLETILKNHFNYAGLDAEIRFVDKLIYQPNGKFLPVINKVKLA